TGPLFFWLQDDQDLAAGTIDQKGYGIPLRSMPQRAYVKEKVKESLEAVAHAKSTLEVTLEAADKLVISHPDEAETIRISGLSPREKEVLTLFAAGKNYKQIAAHLHISPATVKVHRRHIFRHLKTDDIATITRIAVRNGLVDMHV